MQGAELEIDWRPSAWRVLASAGWTDAGFDHFMDAYGIPVPQPIDRSHEDFSSVPDLTANLRIEYGLQTRFGLLTPSFELYHKGDISYHQNPVGFATGQLTQAAHTLGNARVEWRLPNGDTTLSAYMNNIADKLYFVEAFDTSASLGTSGFVFGPPRSYGLRITQRF